MSMYEFFKVLSQGEWDILNEKEYDEALNNLENMSYWFPKISSSTTAQLSYLKLPKTKIVTLNFDWFKWLRSDSYTNEKIQAFNEYLKHELDGFKENNISIFMKTGVFSNKFDFNNVIINNSEQIGEKFLNMYYSSMLVGADMTAEVVLREMIEDAEDRRKIYNGMPLHTEFRVFYDFDSKKCIGVTNYWHPELMIKNLRGVDLESFLYEKDNLVKDFEQYKNEITNQVGIFMSGVSDLSGKWSVDIMKNGQDFWLIDMARMQFSALVGQMEEVY